MKRSWELGARVLEVAISYEKWLKKKIQSRVLEWLVIVKFSL